MNKICLAVALFIGAPLWAQTNSILTWEQCLEQTERYNPDLISAKAAVRELQHKVVSASSDFLPQINASAAFSKAGNEGNSGWSESDSSSASIKLSQTLYSGGGTTAKREVARIALQIGREQYRATLSDIEQRTRLAYIDVLYAQELTELTRQISERRADNVRLIQLRFDGGRENAGSLARNKAQLVEAQFEQREASRSMEYALRNLSAAIGRMEPIAGVSGDMTAREPEPLTNLMKRVRQTPDYKIAKQQVESARQGLVATRSDRFPSIQFNASSSLSGDRDLKDESWNMGVSMSIPLFTGKRILSEVLADTEKVVQSEMDLLDTGNSLAASLQGSWNDYTDAVEYETVQQTTLDAEILREKISTAQYKQGLLDYEDWDTIESNLISQKKLYLQRQRSAAIQEANWRNALGRSFWTPLEESN